MSYTLQFGLTDTIATGSTLNSGATSTTLTSGNFGSPSGTQLYVVDYDIPGSAEIISATVAGTAMTSITRGLSGGAAGTTNHAASAKIGAIFVPQHYAALVDGSGWSTSAITLGYAQITADFTSSAVSTATDVTGLSVTVTVPSGGRRMKITAYGAQFTTSGVAGTAINAAIQEGATQLANNTYRINTSNYGVPMIAMYSAVPTAGSHTYKVTMTQNAAGTMSLGASATTPAFILVELI